MHKAVIARDLDSIHFLMERGVDPMIEDARWGSSPRRWATFDDATEIMELLSKYEEEWQDDDDGQRQSIVRSSCRVTAAISSGVSLCPKRNRILPCWSIR